MLKPALLYKKEIEQNILNLAYSDEMFLFTGTLKYIIPDFEDNNGSLYQYAILDKDKIIGYFTYYIDWYTSSVSNFGLIAFDPMKNVLVEFVVPGCRMCDKVEDDYQRLAQEYIYHDDVIYEIVFNN